MIAHDQARNGRYGLIDYTISLHNLINSLRHRTIRSFSDSSCASLPPLNLLRIHLSRLLPSLLKEFICFLLFVYLADIDSGVFELNIP